MKELINKEDGIELRKIALDGHSWYRINISDENLIDYYLRRNIPTVIDHIDELEEAELLFDLFLDKKMTTEKAEELSSRLSVSSPYNILIVDKKPAKYPQGASFHNPRSKSKFDRKFITMSRKGLSDEASTLAFLHEMIHERHAKEAEERGERLKTTIREEVITTLETAIRLEELEKFEENEREYTLAYLNFLLEGKLTENDEIDISTSEEAEKVLETALEFGAEEGWVKFSNFRIGKEVEF